MLRLDDRQVLLRALQPPSGYHLYRAIGTSFTLELLALLVAPLSFAVSEWVDSGERSLQNGDPYALLAGLRGHAKRMSVFCQAGQIKVPRRYEQLYGYLEDSVFEVSPAGDGVFHPKVWVLRFTCPDQPVRYRLVCLTRNLTFDRSWDTVLVMEGTLTDRKYAYAINHPLGDFVAALPRMVRGPLPGPVRDDLDRIQNEVRRVKWELPNSFGEYAFWPVGIPGHRTWPFGGRRDRMLIVSPFLSRGCLERLVEEGSDHILVSRPESLEDVAVDGLRFSRIHTFSEAAEGEPDDEEATVPEGERALAGLHAKLYVADAGWNARVWTGSANATDRAFGGNVEFLVELRGKKSHCGVDAVLGADDRHPGLAVLLEEFAPEVRAAPDPVGMALKQRLEELRRALAASGLEAVVTAAGEDRSYSVVLDCRHPPDVDPEEVTATCWPISLPESMAVPLGFGSRPWAGFGPVSLEALTPFFAFSVIVARAGRREATRFVLKVPLQGAPDDRQDIILQSLLRDRNGTLRFLLFLLADEGGEGAGAPGMGAVDLAGRVGYGMAGVSLFESLMRALDRNPGKLDEVARLVEDLRKTPGGRELLPDGLDDIWEPIWAARCGLGDE